MNLIACICNKCRAELGQLVNRWTSVDGDGISPHGQQETIEFRVILSGPVCFGKVNTSLDGCVLQNIDCAECHANVGRKCVQDSVEQSLLRRGQVIFNAESINLRSVAKKCAVGARIRAQTGRVSSTEDISNDASRHQLRFDSGRSPLRQYIDDITLRGHTAISDLETTVSSIKRQNKLMAESISDIRTDQKSHIEALEQAVRTSDSHIEGLYEQLDTTQRALQISQDKNACLENMFKNLEQGLRTDVSLLLAGALKSTEEASQQMHGFEQMRADVEELRAKVAEKCNQPLLPTSSSSFQGPDVLVDSAWESGCQLDGTEPHRNTTKPSEAFMPTQVNRKDCIITTRLPTNQTRTGHDAQDSDALLHVQSQTHTTTRVPKRTTRARNKSPQNVKSLRLNREASTKRRSKNTTATKCAVRKFHKKTASRFAKPSKRSKLGRIPSKKRDPEEDGYEAKEVLARWETNEFLKFLVEWEDGSPPSWEMSVDVGLQLVADFEYSYRGPHDDSVDIIDSRVEAGRKEYLVRWRGNERAEECWVDKKLISPQCVTEFETR